MRTAPGLSPSVPDPTANGNHGPYPHWEPDSADLRENIDFPCADWVVGFHDGVIRHQRYDEYPDDSTPFPVPAITRSGIGERDFLDAKQIAALDAALTERITLRKQQAAVLPAVLPTTPARNPFSL